MTSATTPQPAPNPSAKKRNRRASRLMPTLITVAIVSLVGWVAYAKTHPAVNPLGKLITTKVTRGDLLESIAATGSVEAQTGAQVKIGSQITGVIKHLYADVGTIVKKNQLIAELDLPDIEANLRQANATTDAAITHYQQQVSGILEERTQTSSAIALQQATLNSAQAKLNSAIAAYNQQVAQTPQDIAKAQAAVQVAAAALSTAKSNQVQTKASVDLEVETAVEAVTQAIANQYNNNVSLTRNKALLEKGFVAQSVVDAAQALATVADSQVSAAKQNVDLVKEKVRADLQSASDAVSQAVQNLGAAKAALSSAQAETYLDKARQADVADARAAVRQAQANLAAAIANSANDILKNDDVRAAQQAVDADKAAADNAKAQVNKTFIRTPINGTVLQLAAQQGETLAAGLAAPTLIIVADLDRLEVDAFVDETDIGKVRKGQEADITVDAFPKTVFHGNVFKIASGSTIQNGVVTYDVSVTVKDTKHRLKPDMTASVTINTGKLTNVLLVPSEAIKANSRGGTVKVLGIKDGQQAIIPTKVKTGGSDGSNTEIRDGLKEGQTIVLAGGETSNQQFGPQSPFGPSGGRPGSGGAAGGGGSRGGGGGGGSR